MTDHHYSEYLVGDGDRRALHYVALSALCGLLALVLLARWLWELPGVEAFVRRYPGTVPTPADPGTPLWVVALHALNLFFIVQLVASGWAVRTARRPIGHWTPRSGSRAPVTLEQWFHVAVDLLWLASGTVFVVLMFVTGRWVRIVPTSWDVVPNAISVALTYLSLHWPAEDSWVAYNALQMLAYFLVVFVLAPLAAVTGWRLSFLWPRAAGWQRLPIEPARKVHFAVMVGFVAFVVVHVAMVVLGGPVRLLNHMFAGNDSDSVAGVLVLCGVLAVSGLAVAAARPVVIRSLAGLTGRVTR